MCDDTTAGPAVGLSGGRTSCEGTLEVCCHGNGGQTRPTCCKEVSQQRTVNAVKVCVGGPTKCNTLVIHCAALVVFLYCVCRISPFVTDSSDAIQLVQLVLPFLGKTTLALHVSRRVWCEINDCVIYCLVSLAAPTLRSRRSPDL